MKQITSILISITFIVFTGLAGFNVLAAESGHTDETQITVTEQTTTFAIENMYCAMCPITVKKAMERVDGVKSVVVDFNAKTATVIFNPTIATPEQIGSASTNVGYPATPISS